MQNKDRVKYTGTSQSRHRNRFGTCLGQEFVIQGWIYIEVLFDNESTSNIVNVEI